MIAKLVNTQKIMTFMAILIMAFFVLSILSGIFIPLVLALFLVMLQRPLLFFFIRLKIPNWLAVTLISILSLLILFVVISIVSQTASEVAANSDELLIKIQNKMDIFLKWLNRLIRGNLNTFKIMEYVSSLTEASWFANFLGDIAKSLGSFTGSFFMFALYYMILLYGFSDYKEYLIYVTGGDSNNPVLEIFEKVMESISDYMGIKFFVSLLTGGLFWGICQFYGIQFALFWAFLAFVLNFIPSIGSIVATIPPIIMGFIFLDSTVSMIVFPILLVSVQTIVGNVIDPIIMGNRLKLNTMTVILGLVFWGYIWGVAGMLISVPLLVLMKIILEQFPETSMIARAMGTPSEEKVSSSVKEKTTLLDYLKRSRKARKKDESHQNDSEE